MSEKAIRTVRSFADGVGLLLSGCAIALIAYLELGDWLLRSGLITEWGHTAGAAIAFVGAAFLAIAAGAVFIERYEEDD